MTDKLLLSLGISYGFAMPLQPLCKCMVSMASGLVDMSLADGMHD